MVWWALRLVALLGAIVVTTNYLVGLDTGDGDVASTAAGNRQTASLARGEEPVSYSGNELAIPVAPDGHFYVDVTIEGSDIPFLVDTGASGIFLNRAAADDLGLDMEELSYTIITQTANGRGRAAPIVLSDVRLDGIEMSDVNAIVNDAPMNISLLGMSFLSRLESYEVRNGYLILRW